MDWSKARAVIFIFLTIILAEGCLAATTLAIRHAGYGYHFEPYQSAAEPISPPGARTKALELLATAMNSVSTREKHRNEAFPTEFNALRDYVKNHGVLCGGMAYLYHGYLDRAKIPNRVVYFTAELGTTVNSHVTVEVFIDGKWIIFDPTFHVIPELNGEPLGARDLMNLYYAGRSSSVAFEFLGNVAYPARIGNYYMKYANIPRYVYYVHRYSLIGRMRPSSNIAIKILHALLMPATYASVISYYILPDNILISKNMADQYTSATNLTFFSDVIIPISMALVFALGGFCLLVIVKYP